MEEFQNRIDNILSMIGTDNLSYNKDESPIYEKDFNYIDEYCAQKGLINTAVALRVVRTLHDGMYRGTVKTADGTEGRRPYACHCFSVCRIMINLNLPIESRDEDIMLTAALCHDLPAFVPAIKNDHAMVNVYHIDPAAEDLVFLIYTRDAHNDEEMERVFNRVSENRLAAIIKLADRGNVVEELFNFSVWHANEYIHETRVYYLPLCIHAREYYPEIDRALGILQEKIRDITEATEIFLDRYIKLENEKTTQILTMLDENSRMRTRIRKNIKI